MEFYIQVLIQASGWLRSWRDLTGTKRRPPRESGNKKGRKRPFLECAFAQLLNALCKTFRFLAQSANILHLQSPIAFNYQIYRFGLLVRSGKGYLYLV